MERPFWSGALIGGVVAVGAACLQLPVPWPYPDRLAVIAEEASRINNEEPYDATEKWARNGSQAGLHLLNPTRVAFFNDKIRGTIESPFHVLDMGCGGGLVSNALAGLPNYASIDGVDLSAPALSYASMVAEQLRGEPRPRFQNASLYTLPFKDGAYDAVVMSDVLEHLHDVPRALSEAYRVLRPGGILVFDTIDRSVATYIVAILGAEYIVGIINKGSHDWRLFLRPDELGRGLEGAGFKDFAYEGFQPSLRALAELSALSYGLLAAESMSGGWGIEPPSPLMVSYIGHAVKPR